ncbi:MAG TPA: Dickkopf N-terminal cysteine-rich domain-containing protein [Myxococcales bacterium LLY-WYZ-16_1]|jgi:hypothetical protein|nr:Dickkopf N-terminal cysteine-rich domain-containing protein [Myxococcales bacterium LLY-WYZ-16_1]
MARWAWGTWFLFLFLLAFFGCGLAGCSSSDGCSSDSDCPEAFRCDRGSGTCVCATDAACEPGFECNRAGQCQATVGCSRNADCVEGTFCDLTSGQCAPGPAAALQSVCSVASQCPLGSVCTEGLCAEGCFDSGDCPLGDVCLNGFCSDEPGRCEDDSFCPYGDRCVDGFCQDDFRGPYCRGCTQRTQSNPDPCDGSKNFCLINSVELGGQTQFCGVDCSDGQPCPNGYQCNRVVRLTGDPCGATAQCQCSTGLVSTGITCELSQPCEVLLPDGRPDPDAQFCFVDGIAACGDAPCEVEVGQSTGTCLCAGDDMCPADAVCAAGRCCPGPVDPARICARDEGDLEGFCTCSQDSDCAQNTCSFGTCSSTGDPCTPGAGDCPPVRCEDGGCVVGRNCAPEPGLACSVLRE